MRTFALLSFTENGAKVGERLKQVLDDTFCFHGFVSSKFVGETALQKNTGSLSEWTAQWFAKADCLVFVGACGIAVRAIAPFVKDKFADPAVLVIDEQARFCISLMSGHMGGANELTALFADILGAQPVITTATDLNCRFAVDVFAKKNRLVLTDRKIAKEISAALLSGKKVLFETDFSVEQPFPDGLVKDPQQADSGLAIKVSLRKPKQENTLWLVPKAVTLGIGCRKETPQKTIEDFVTQKLAEASLPMEAVCAIASIDLKANEQGLLDFCKAHELPFDTYSAQTLAQVEGDFSPSAFVKSVTGVDNVCERSAVVHSKGTLLLAKQKGSGVTLAAAADTEKIRLQF